MNKKFLLIFGLLLLMSIGFVSASGQCDGVSPDGRVSMKIVDNPKVCPAFLWSNGLCCDSPESNDLCKSIGLSRNGSHVDVTANGVTQSYQFVVGDVPEKYWNSRLVTNGVIAIASGEFGTLRSIDGGKSWSKIMSDGFLGVCMSDDGKYVYLSGGRFLRSDNFGASFTRVDSPVYPPTFVDVSGWSGKSFHVTREYLHTGGHLLDISPDGRFVVTASRDSGAFGGWAWSSSDFGVTMTPLSLSSDTKFLNLYSSDNFRTVVLTSDGSYSGGRCVEQVGHALVSNDFGVSWRGSTLGIRNWLDVVISADGSSISVVSVPSGTGLTGYGNCASLDQFSLRSAIVDYSSNYGLSWNSRSLNPSEQNLLTGGVVDIPEYDTSSVRPSVLGYVMLVLLFGTLMILIFRKKKSKRGRK